MNLQQAELYQRIQAFELDEPEAKYPFSRRLARENYWSAEYTQRAIAEYKKFAFLAVVPGHPVSPPEPIDQVWHLHLIYTRSYWGEFCPNILQKAFHHQPSQGGTREKDKFTDWYAQTLTSYEHFFGETPPADIWYPLVAPVKAKQQKPQFGWVRVAVIVLAVAIAFTVTACQPLDPNSINNPLNFRGSKFLLFYLWVGSIATALAWGGRWLLLHIGLSQTSPTLDIYQIAYLAEGKQRAIDSAIANLVHRGYLTVVTDQAILEIQQELPYNSHPLEQAIMQAAKSDGHIWSIRADSTVATDAIAQSLQTLGLLVKQEYANFIGRISALPLFGVLLFGLTKIAIGVMRDKPVTNLVFLCILTFLVGRYFLVNRPHRHHNGDRLLDELHAQYVRNSTPSNFQPDLSVALLGVKTLARTNLAGLYTLLKPPVISSSSSSCSNCSSSSCSSSSSNCSSSSCSSSSSNCSSGCGGCSS